MRKILYVCLGVILLLGVSYFFLNKEVKIVNTEEPINPIRNVTNDNQFYLNSFESSKYNALSDSQKKVVESYYASQSASYKEEVSIDQCSVAYFGADGLSLIGCASVKPTLPLNFFDSKNNKIINFGSDSISYMYPINLEIGFNKLGNEYLISIYQDRVVYFKPGMREVKVAEGSVLSKGETYVKQGGMVDEYGQVSFDSKTKILSVTIFQDSHTSDKQNVNLRDVKLVLP